MAKWGRTLPKKSLNLVVKVIRFLVRSVGIKSFLEAIQNGRLQTTIKWRFIDRFFSNIPRSQLKNTTFSIICNNCIGGGIYHKFGVPYASPTVGLFFFSRDYINFLENFHECIKQPLQFKTVSRYKEANELRRNTRLYPIGLLREDIEVHFLHYHSEREALEKWNRRIARLNFENLFFIYSDGGGGVAGAGGSDFIEEYLTRYEELPFHRKIFFSSKPRSGKTVIFLKEFDRELFVPDSTCSRKYEKYLDLVKWLNAEKTFLKKPVDNW